MQEAGQIVPEPLVGAAECQVVPWNLGLIEFRGLQAFVVGAEAAPGGGCGIDDDDRVSAGV